ncbi:MAG: CoA-binding protein [Candidatus Hodarchaeota archaeon]
MKKRPPLKSFFSPKSVAIIGASAKEGKFGYQIIKNLENIRYNGKIFPVNSNSKENILNFTTYKSLKELPEVPELVVIVLPPKEALKAVYKSLDFGIKNIMLESSFISEEIEDELRNASCQMGFRIMGSNTIGLINFNDRFSTSIIPVRCKIGKDAQVGYIAQSGGLAGGCGWWKPHTGCGFSKVIHLGRSCDINEAEVIEYLTEDDNTKVITLFLKRVSDRIINTVKNCVKIKPIIYLKIENSPPFIKLEEAGAIPVDTYQDLFEISKAFIQAPLLKGENIGIIGPSSGAQSLITSKLKESNLKVAKNLSPKTEKILRENVLHKDSKILNPVDYWPPTKFDGEEVCNKYKAATEALLADKNVDAVIIILELFREIEFNIIKAFSGLKEKYPTKPIIAACVQVEPDVLERVLEGLSELNILCYDFNIEKSVQALSALRKFELIKGK